MSGKSYLITYQFNVSLTQFQFHGKSPVKHFCPTLLQAITQIREFVRFCRWNSRPSKKVRHCYVAQNLNWLKTLEGKPGSRAVKSSYRRMRGTTRGACQTRSHCVGSLDWQFLWRKLILELIALYCQLWVCGGGVNEHWEAVVMLWWRHLFLHHHREELRG